jgi:hypothetical protein
MQQSSETIANPDLQEIYTAALTIENPLDRGTILGCVAGKLLGEPGFEAVKQAAITAHTESCQAPWNNGWYEFSPEGVICGIAQATQDPTLVQSLPASYSKNSTLVKIAIRCNNPDIVPNDSAWHDTYRLEQVKQTYAEEDARAITDIEARLTAFDYIAAHYRHTGNHQQAALLHAEIWQTIPQEADEIIRDRLYVHYVEDFAAAHSIPELVTRLRAYSRLYDRLVRKENPESFESYRQASTQAIREALAERPQDVDQVAISRAVLSVYTHTRDHQLIPYISDASIKFNAEYDQTLTALRELGDISQISTGPHTHYQGTHMAEIVKGIRTEEAALNIEDAWWRNRALAHVTAHMADGPEKIALQERVIQNALANPNNKEPYYVNSDVVSVVRTMGDVRVGWRLLQDNRISCNAISKIAEAFNDGQLALQIQDEHPGIIGFRDGQGRDGQQARDCALQHIATRTQDIDLARKIDHPIRRSWALLHIYEAKQEKAKN